MRIGITGHSNLTADSERPVYAAIRSILQPYSASGFSGTTCLARGSDQLFAQVVLDLRQQLLVVLPSASYRAEKVKPADLETFDALLSRAAGVEYMPFDEPGPDAYMAASAELVSRSELLIAIWDGNPSGGHGGTADVVAHARQRGRTVQVLWPPGAARV